MSEADITMSNAYWQAVTDRIRADMIDEVNKVHYVDRWALNVGVVPEDLRYILNRTLGRLANFGRTIQNSFDSRPE